jgi:hypothetical protein
MPEPMVPAPKIATFIAIPPVYDNKMVAVL